MECRAVVSMAGAMLALCLVTTSAIAQNNQTQQNQTQPNQMQQEVRPGGGQPYLWRSDLTADVPQARTVAAVQAINEMNLGVDEMMVILPLLQDLRRQERNLQTASENIANDLLALHRSGHPRSSVSCTRMCCAPRRSCRHRIEGGIGGGCISIHPLRSPSSPGGSPARSAEE